METAIRRRKLLAFTCRPCWTAAADQCVGFMAALGGVTAFSSEEGPSSTASASSSVVLEDCASLVKEGRFHDAIPVCSSEIQAKEGVDVDLLLHRAMALVQANQPAKALGDFDAVLNAKPGMAEALVGRAEILMRQGRFEQARQDLAGVKVAAADVLQKRLKTAEARARDVARLMGDRAWEAANAVLEKLQLEDRVDLSKEVYTQRAECLTWLKKYTDAIRVYQGRSVLELESSETAYEVGKLYLALGNLDKGRRLIDDCARNNSAHRPALALRKALKAVSATIAEADKMLIKQAVAALEAALEQTGSVKPGEAYYDEKLAGEMLARPFELPILKLLCSKHIRLKQTDLALQRCQRVHDLSQQQTSGKSREEEESAILSLSEAYALAEKYEEAVALLKKAQRAHPRSSRVNEALQKTSKDLQMSKRRDYYKIIGVPKTATDAEIKRAYNKQARLWHPDKHHGDEEKKKAEVKMQDLNAAMAVLTDKKKRAQFDAGMDPEDPNGGAHQHHHHGGHHHGGFGGFGGGGFNINIEDIIRAQQQQQRRGGGGGQRRAYQGHGGGGNFDDFFKWDL